MSVGPRKLGVNNKDVATLSASIAERVLFYRRGEEILPPLEPKRGAFRRLRTFKKRLLCKFGFRPAPLTPNEFVNMYKGRKKTIYEHALIEYLAGGVKDRHALIRAFVKAEKVNTEKAPRCIQPRHPVYNIGLGCYLKHIEHRLYKAIARVYNQKFVVSKGMNVAELGQGLSQLWDDIVDPVFVGFDASRFDMHVSQDALRWEHSIYLALYNYDPELARLLTMQLVNKGTGWCPDGRVKYKTIGCRMSGDMNTGLGNCLLMCGMVYEYMGRLDSPYRFINNGDDCGVILSRKDLPTLDDLPGYFGDLGFRMEVEEPVDVLERVVFCQMQPVRTEEGYVMVRQFHTALEKDTMSIVPLTSTKMVRKWMYAVGECGLALCSGIPVMQSFYEVYMREGLPSNMSQATYMESGARNLAIGMASKSRPVSSVARWSFYLAFGVSPADQEQLEQYYSRMVFGGQLPVSDSRDVPGLLVTRIDQ